MKCFSWLHLTDLHRGMAEQRWLWPSVKEIFFEDLKRLHDKCGPWDLVLFTGDLTQRGSVEEFQEVNELLGQLWERFGKLGSKPKLLVVPGNHDLVRPNEKKPAVRLLKQWNDYQDIQKEFWDDEESDYRRIVTEAFKNYVAWWDKQPYKAKGLTPGILPGDFSVSIEKDGVRLGIVGLNTAFLQLTDGDYESKLALHARQFQVVCGGDGPSWTKQHHACLLLTHHPPAWLNPDSQQHLYGEIVARGRFAVHLCGHMHGVAYRNIAEGGTESRRTWQGCSLFGLEFFGTEGNKEERLHGYTAGKIELYENKGNLMFWPRKTQPQPWQMGIVPDYSLELNDNQHTNPIDFKLLQSIESTDGRNGEHKPRPVDRDLEVTIFIAVLESHPQQATSILLVKDSVGRGKTTLLELYEEYCQGHNIPVARVDLKTSKNPMEISEFILAALKKKYNDVREPSPDEQKQWSPRAFLDYLMKLTHYIQLKRFVLLLDTYDKAGSETKNWITDHLLRMAMPSRVSCLVIVLAGKEVPDPTGEWAPYCSSLSLQRLRLEDWQEHAERVDPSLEQERVRIMQLYNKHADNPLEMATQIDVLARERRA